MSRLFLVDQSGDDTGNSYSPATLPRRTLNLVISQMLYLLTIPWTLWKTRDRLPYLRPEPVLKFRNMDQSILDVPRDLENPLLDLLLKCDFHFSGEVLYKNRMNIDVSNELSRIQTLT